MPTPRSVRFPTREAWLEAHEGIISASRVATILGMNPWRSPLSEYAVSVGAMAPEQETISMRRGLAMEPLIAALYAEETQRLTVQPKPFTMFYHPAYPWIACTPDAMWRNGGACGVLELKDVGHRMASEWDDEPPLIYRVQLQVQIWVMREHGLDGPGSLAAVLDGSRFVWRDEVLHQEFIDAIIPRLEEFRRRVELRDPPPAIGGDESSLEALKALYPTDSGETVWLPPEAEEWARQYEEAKCQEKEAGERKNMARALLYGAIGNATFGRLPSGLVYSLKSRHVKEHIVRARDERVLRLVNGRG